MMFKKTTHLVFSLALILGLIGCDSSTTRDDDNNVETRETQDSSNRDSDRTVDRGTQSVEDNTAPIITITGDNPLEITQGETFSDPGATAMDDIDGVVTVTPTGSVDMNIAGSYIITYTATDNAGNESTATRTIEVKPTEVVWNVSNVAEFRQALEDASANGENDRIVLSAGTYKTTSDGLGTFTFNDNEEFDLTIESAEGLTRQDVVLSGDKSTQVFNFDNTDSATLILKNISIINGDSTSDGGGVYTNQNIKIEDCNISNNSASSNGGGFYSSGTTEVTNSTISNNRSSGNGGGFSSSDTTIVDTSTISNNISIRDDGGFSSSGQTTVKKSIISNNNSGHYNGGFGSYNTTIVNNSTIFDNKSNWSTGGFGSLGITTVIDSSIVNNSAKDNYGGFWSGSATTITNSIVSNNNATNNGGFYSRGTTTITNIIISNNNATNNIGGFESNDVTIIVNSIILNNKAKDGEIGAFSANNSYVSNNILIGNNGSIYAKGIFINNIFSENDSAINLTGDSKIYNNYIEYSEIENNGHNVIKKQNLQPASVGDVHLNSDNKTLSSDSPVIDKGLNPSSATYKQIIDNDDIYNQMIELLKTDIDGNQRVTNGTIDMGAKETL